MPQLRYYVVTQVREVKVLSTNLAGAGVLAQRVFRGEKRPEDQINVQSDPHEHELIIREER